MGQVSDASQRIKLPRATQHKWWCRARVHLLNKVHLKVPIHTVAASIYPALQFDEYGVLHLRYSRSSCCVGGTPSQLPCLEALYLDVFSGFWRLHKIKCSWLRVVLTWFLNNISYITLPVVGSLIVFGFPPLSIH
jgi:hypothetical protein